MALIIMDILPNNPDDIRLGVDYIREDICFDSDSTLTVDGIDIMQCLNDLKDMAHEGQEEISELQKELKTLKKLVKEL